jgi:hypothetical protein
MGYIGIMIRHFLASLVLCCTVTSVQAEEEPSMMERGAQLFFEGLMQEMEPALDDLQGLAERFGPAMRGFVQEMGPALGELFDKVEDWSVYQPPELLPNGDIIIRRKTPDPDNTPEPKAPDEGPIDL